MARTVYTKDQLDFLRNGCKWMAIGKLTEAFNARFGLAVSESQITAAKKNHRIIGGRQQKSGARVKALLTAEQAAFVDRMYRVHTGADLARVVNARFGLSLKISQIRSYLKNHGIQSGRDGRFVNGNKPWNNGLKGKGICKPNSGTFAKGNIPARTRELGEERICSKDGFVLVKVSEANPYTGAVTRFKHKHVVIWERHHGRPVPPGMVVRFADCDKMNFEPENLILITRAENLRLNQLGLSEYPEELRPSVIAIAKLEVKTFGKIRKTTEKSPCVI